MKKRLGPWQKEILERLLMYGSIPANVRKILSPMATPSEIRYYQKSLQKLLRYVEDDPSRKITLRPGRSYTEHYVMRGPLKYKIACEVWPKPTIDALEKTEKLTETESYVETADGKIIVVYNDRRVRVISHYFSVMEGSNWGNWPHMLSMPLDWRAASMITAYGRAIHEWSADPIGYMLASGPVSRIITPEKENIFITAYRRVGRVTRPTKKSEAILVVAPVDDTYWNEEGWEASKARVIAAVVADDSKFQEAEWDVPRVVKVPRAIGPFVAQKIALESLEQEYMAEELGR